MAIHCFFGIPVLVNCCCCCASLSLLVLMIHPASYSSFVHKFRQFRRCWHSTQAHPNLSASYVNSGWNNSDWKYALGGWTFFILENIVLSENRAAIIASLNGRTDDPANLLSNDRDFPDESNYRLLYGTFSTIATISILYGYRQLRIATSQVKTSVPFKAFGSSSRLAAVSMISLGLVLMSQTLPKLQIPVELVLPTGSTSKKEEQLSTAPASGKLTDSTQANTESKSWNMKIRCPFDFSSSKHLNGSLNDFNVAGVERITRHPGLWSFGLVCAGNAFLQPTSGLALWMTGPFLVALFGGYHQDSRASRNMGESFPSVAYEQQTSNVPFMAMLLGKQKEQNAMSSFYVFITQELKPINAFVAFTVAALYVANKRPVQAAAIGTKVATSARKL